MDFNIKAAEEMTEEGLAETLEYIASQIREGYTSGNANLNNVWWSVTGVIESE